MISTILEIPPIPTNASLLLIHAGDGEKITTLDEKEFELNNSNLVICDGKKPVALAGIMGGLNSEIQDTKKK